MSNALLRLALAGGATSPRAPFCRNEQGTGRFPALLHAHGRKGVP